MEDTAESIRRIGLGPVSLVGQSMGANTAMLTAARHPDLVNRLVMIEGSPDGPEPPDPEPAVAEHVREALTQWPVPFADARAARTFFAGKGFEPAMWTAGLEERDGQLWPRFEIDTLVECMVGLGSRSCWLEWRSIQCRAHVILGENGMFPAGHGEQIVSQLPGAKLTTIRGAGHDVHLDAPEAWVRAMAGDRETGGSAPGTIPRKDG